MRVRVRPIVELDADARAAGESSLESRDAQEAILLLQSDDCLRHFVDGRGMCERGTSVESTHPTSDVGRFGHCEAQTPHVGPHLSYQMRKRLLEVVHLDEGSVFFGEVLA